MTPKKAIEEDDDDKAHLDEEAPKIIQFLYTSKGQEFMHEKILKSDQGISHDVFKEQSVVEGSTPEGEEGGEGAAAKPDMEDIINTFKHVYVKEVVREPRMHFYKVPRLGCFMAVPLVYNSCLFDTALDNAVTDYFEVMKKNEEREKQLQED